MSLPLGKALFLDRDGVVNEEVGYLYRAEDVRFVHGIFPLCRTALRAGYHLVIITNQSGIARGLYTEADFHALMDWMRRRFEREQVPLDAVYFCPYHPEQGVGVYRREHEDRKPGVGMLRRAARDLNLNLHRSLLVGDRCSDVIAANTAGLRKTFLLGGTETGLCTGNYLAVQALSEVEPWLASGSDR